MKELTDLHLAPSGLHPVHSFMTQLCHNSSNCYSLLSFSDIAYIILIHNIAKPHAPSPLSAKNNSMFHEDFACGTKMKAVIFINWNHNVCLSLILGCIILCGEEV